MRPRCFDIEEMLASVIQRVATSGSELARPYVFLVSLHSACPIQICSVGSIEKIARRFPALRSESGAEKNGAPY